jgi:hypothetical protein
VDAGDLVVPPFGHAAGDCAVPPSIQQMDKCVQAEEFVYVDQDLFALQGHQFVRCQLEPSVAVLQEYPVQDIILKQECVLKESRKG